MALQSKSNDDVALETTSWCMVNRIKQQNQCRNLQKHFFMATSPVSKQRNVPATLGLIDKDTVERTRGVFLWIQFFHLQFLLGYRYQSKIPPVQSATCLPEATCTHLPTSNPTTKRTHLRIHHHHHHHHRDHAKQSSHKILLQSCNLFVHISLRFLFQPPFLPLVPATHTITGESIFNLLHIPCSCMLWMYIRVGELYNPLLHNAFSKRTK